MGAAGCVKRTPPGTPREVQEERMQRIETSKCEENEVEAVLTGSSRPVLGLGPITVAEDAIMDTEDEDDEKEQEKEVLGILGITPSSSANDLATSASTTPTAASTRPSPSTPSVVRFNSFPVDWHVHHISPAKGFPMAPASDASGLRSLPASLTNRSAEGSSLSPVDRSFVSTPSVTSASSPSQSPSSPLHSLPMSPSEDLDVGSLLAFHSSPRGREMMDSARYNFFLDRFCFWTGDSTSTGPNNSPGHRRIHSESEVDTYFAVHNHVRETSSGLHSLEYQPSSSFTSWMSGWGGSGTGVGSGQVTPTKGVTTPRPGTPSTLLDSTMATPVR
ncbi:hypothetical protein FRB99_004025 [Tulasnella sp. 403]|nr:hypothetical protein FRB99_004025 [Tulasnella sp. 403]